MELVQYTAANLPEREGLAEDLSSLVSAGRLPDVMRELITSSSMFFERGELSPSDAVAAAAADTGYCCHASCYCRFCCCGGSRSRCHFVPATAAAASCCGYCCCCDHFTTSGIAALRNCSASLSAPDVVWYRRPNSTDTPVVCKPRVYFSLSGCAEGVCAHSSRTSLVPSRSPSTA